MPKVKSYKTINSSDGFRCPRCEGKCFRLYFTTNAKENPVCEYCYFQSDPQTARN